MTRIFLVEDHPVMREGYRSLIGGEPDMTVCGEASSAEEALQAIQDLDFDVAIVDLSLPGANGIEFLQQLLALRPSTRILVSSAHDEELYAERALRAGAQGYVMKYGEVSRFVEAVRTVAEGDIYLSDALRARLIREQFSMAEGSGNGINALTNRELEVFEHFGRGKGTREVAEAIHLSVKTIESHRANIKRKLGLSSAVEFVQRAALWVESPLLSSAPDADGEAEDGA